MQQIWVYFRFSYTAELYGILDSLKQVCLLKMSISDPKVYNTMVIDMLHIYGYGFRNPIKKPMLPTLQVIWVYTMFTVGAQKHKKLKKYHERRYFSSDLLHRQREKP